MKKKLFRKLMKRKMNLELPGMLISKMLILVPGIALLSLGSYLVNNESIFLGVVVLATTGFVYVVANVKWLVPVGMEIEDFLFSFFHSKRIVRFYDLYNRGAIQ